jgi:hypothetical protein
LTQTASIGLFSLLALGVTAAGATAAERSELPIAFIAEHVVLHIEPDSLRVDAAYVFVCRPDAASAQTSLVYPYPLDPLLGGARTVRLACRLGARDWQELPWRELAGGRGAGWSLPVAVGDTLTVRTVYRQALLTTYARYIVTTTAAWGQPLHNARFEIHLPSGAVPQEFSFPFEPCQRNERNAWCFETTDFLPDRDVVVRWQ